MIKGAFPGQNRLYQNLGDYRFKDVTYPSGIGEYHADSFTAVFADFTGDASPDIYQANDHRADRFYQNVGRRTLQGHRAMPPVSPAPATAWAWRRRSGPTAASSST